MKKKRPATPSRSGRAAREASLARFYDRVQKELLPMVESSAVAVSIVPDDANKLDVKWCTKLGMMIMLNKPIMVVAGPGRSIPPGLLRVADEVVEDCQMDDPATQKRLVEAINSMIGRLPKSEDGSEPEIKWAVADPVNGELQRLLGDVPGFPESLTGELGEEV